jgi:hypothetical protein
MAIRGVKVKQAEAVTMPITGIYLALDKSAKVPMLYVQHRTHTGPGAPVSYKAMPCITTNTESLFSRLGAACGVKVLGLKQREAARKIASAIAEKGAIAANRVGKAHDWVNIKLVNWDSELLPWHLPTRPGLEMISLLEQEQEEPAPVDDYDDMDEESAAVFSAINLEEESAPVFAQAGWSMTDWSAKLNVDCLTNEGRSDNAGTKLYQHYNGDKMLEPKLLIKALRGVNLEGVAKKFSREAALALKALIVVELEKLP